MKYYISIIIGLLIGFTYYHFFEKRMINNEFDMECWAKLHYLGKQRSSLAKVHIKSILWGLLIIYLSYGNTWRNFVLSVSGAAIIGLHIGQAYNEFNYIENYSR